MPHGTAWAWSGFADPPDVPLSLSSDFRYYRTGGCFTVSSAAANDLKALAAFNRACGAMAVTEAQVKAIKVPTLGIIGSADPSAPTMRELGPLMPALKLVIVDGAEHGGERGILRRKEFLPTVREFLAAHGTR